MVDKLRECRAIIKALTLLMIVGFVLVECYKNTQEYIYYHDKVIGVECIVTDAVNYTESQNGDIKFNSIIVGEWNVNDKKYTGKINQSGTTLVGSKIRLNVLKEDPQIIKVVSFRNVVIASVVAVFMILFTIIYFAGDLVYSRFILREKKKQGDDLYDYAYDEELKEVNKKKRSLRFKMVISFLSMIIFAGISLFGINNMRIWNSREYINVDCLVTEVQDSTSDSGQKYGDVCAKWEINGQVYKKILDNTQGNYEKGQTYNIKVLKDTEEIDKLTSTTSLKDIIIFSIIALISLVIFIIEIIRYKKLID